MPAELPGFYFDSERNRYFPLPRHQGGRVGPPAGPSYAEAEQGRAGERGEGTVEVREVARCPRVPELLRSRENGRAPGGAFQGRFLESQASRFRVWEYSKQVRRADAALEWVRMRVQTREGERDAAALFVGGSNGSLGVWDTDVRATASDMDDFCRSDSSDLEEESSLDDPWVDAPTSREDGGWNTPEPLIGSRLTHQSALGSAENGSHVRPPVLWRSPDEVMFSSPIRTIHRLPDGEDPALQGGVTTEKVVVTTFGTEGAGGAVIVLEMRDAPFLRRGEAWQQRPFMPWRIASTHSMPGWTLWTSEASPRRGTLGLGYSGGAAVLSLDDGHKRSLCRSSSAVLSQQFDGTGNLVFCGFRNGIISTVDLRLPMPPPQLTRRGNRLFPTGPAPAPAARVSARGMRHHFRQRGPSELLRNSKQTRQGRQKLGPEDPQYCSHCPVMRLSSSVSSMRLLRSDQNYLIASAMDGSLQRWDRRMARRPVLAYEGHVNSHSMLPLAVDPSETLLLSGGEDCKVRLWSISTGRQLACAGIFGATATSVCWPALEGPFGGCQGPGQWENSWFGDSHPWGCWIGSQVSLYYAHGAG